MQENKSKTAIRDRKRPVGGNDRETDGSLQRKLGDPELVPFPERGVSLEDLICDAPLWVAWRRDADGKRIPISPKTGKACGTASTEGWGTQCEAERRVEQLSARTSAPNDSAGIGIMLGPLPQYPGLYLSGIDIDGCRDPESGVLEPWAAEILDRFDTYAEVSPSGGGVHVLFVCSDEDRSALKAEGLIRPGSEYGRDFSPCKRIEIAPRLCGGKWLTYTGSGILPTYLSEVLGDGMAMDVKRIGSEDLRWLFGEHGPAFLRDFQGQTERSSSIRDESGSGIGWRKALDLFGKGMTLEEVAEAFDADGGNAGEWWSRTDDRQRQRVLERACRRVLETRKVRLAELLDEFDDLDDEPGEDDDPDVWRVNRDYAVVDVPGGVAIARFKDDDFDLLSKSSFELKMANRRVLVRDKQAPLSRYWLQHPLRKDFDGLVFDPSGRSPDRMLNMWRGWSVSADVSGSCERFLALIEDVVCPDDPAARDYLIKWFAHMVQYPAVKPGVTLVLIGGKGVGKDSLIEYAGGMLRPKNYVNMDTPTHLTGNFNAHLETCLLGHMQEGVFSGNIAQAEVLKARITGHRQAIERKGLDVFEVDSFTRLAITSNSWNAILASADERRFAVYNCAGKKERAYYDALHQERLNGGPAALMSYLRSIDLADFDVRSPPDSHGLREQKLNSLRGVRAWWLDVLQSGRLPQGLGNSFEHTGDEEGADDWQTHTQFVTTEVLRSDCMDWFRQRRFEGDPPPDRRFSKELKEICPAERERGTGSHRPWGYKIPPWPVCVDHFERHFGVSLDLGE